MEKKYTVFFDYSYSDKIYFDEISIALLARQADIVIQSIDKENRNDEYTLSELHFSDVDLVVLLISKQYFGNIGKQFKFDTAAKNYLDERGIKVVPIKLDSYPLKNSPLNNYYTLPKKGRPMISPDKSSNLFKEVIDDLVKIVEVVKLPKVSLAIREEREHKSKTLNLQGAGLKHIPIDLLTMPWLETLNLEDNAIEKIENLENLKNVTSLKLNGNKIRRIENMSALSKLQQLFMGKNQLAVIENLGSFKQLIVLLLNGNKIREFPDYLFLEKLEYLSLRNNLLTTIPKLVQLPSLKGLYLGNNHIKDLTGINFSLRLTKIDLSGNRIESIRPLLTYIEKDWKIYAGEELPDQWRGINIRHNQNLTEPAIEVIERGNEAILKHFRDADAFGTSKINIIKLILIGNSRSGKTNFSQFIRTGRIAANSTSTHLLDIIMWEPAADKGLGLLKMNIFDFGGQDYYHDAHRMFYSHDTAYVVLWDKESNCYGTKDLESNGYGYDDFPLEYWLESVNYNLLSRRSTEMLDDQETRLMLKQIPILVLQNKIDLLSYNEIHDPAIDSLFLDQARLARTYPNIWGFSSVALKSKKRLSGLNEVITEFIHDLPSVGRVLISYQVDIISYFIRHEQEFQVLSIEEFLALCHSRIKSEKVSFTLEDAVGLANILNNMGLVLYDNNGGVPHIYTNVLELNRIIGKIMLKAKETSENGIFSFQKLGEIKYKELIINLLSRNNSVIDLGNDTYLAPQFLPRQAGYYTRIMAKAFLVNQVRFVYKAYFHKSLLLNIFAKYIVKYGDNSVEFNQQPYWRDGIIITRGTGDASSMVMLEFLRTEKHGIINIRTSGSFNRSNLEGEVARDIEDLSKGWSYEKELSLDGVNFIKVEKLKKNLLNNQFFCHIDKSTHNISAFKNLENFEKLPKKLFISYSSKNIAYARRLMTHLEVLKNAHLIEPWFDRMIDSGSRWDNVIKKEMALSDVVIFLLSPDFLATKYIMEVEVPKAVDLAEQGKTKLFFIELQKCSWLDTVIADFQQTDDPDADAKTPIFIKDPLDDGKWSDVLKELKNTLDI